MLIKQEVVETSQVVEMCPPPPLPPTPAPEVAEKECKLPKKSKAKCECEAISKIAIEKRNAMKKRQDS